jgi:ribosomal protein S18 acetylase RimI-like enzyme
MPATLETIPQPEATRDDAARLQARAFFDDPLFTWVFPDEAHRRAGLPWLMSVGIGLGLRFGEAHTTSGSMMGHAVWLSPGSTHVTPDRLEAAGFVDPERRIGAAALTRFGTFMEQVAPQHEELVPEPHWYLLILGVDPPHQGQGVGGTLMQPVLTRADGEGVRCYLETAKERNVAFYVRHGFDVMREDVVEGGGPRFWMMVRNPRPRG